MSGEGVFCAGCGITLRPFMKVCPRCGLEREGAEPLDLPHPAPETISETGHAAGVTPAAQDIAIPDAAIHQQAISPSRPGFHPANMVFLPPIETSRRFPAFTSAQWALIAIGIGLLVMMLAVAYLLWRQQKRDIIRPAGNTNAVANPSPSMPAKPEVSPAITLPTPEASDDQKITDAVKSALMAYNPLGFTRYKVEVKDGVVTLNGEALHQPEKDGADNVTRLVGGVKSVVNNLKVKPEEPFLPRTVNAAEANLLDEALKRQIQADEQAKQKHLQVDPQREAERQRREIAAARKREEEIALQKAAEEKLRREIEEYEKRQEELRRAEAERRTRAEQARFEVNALRTGTVAWSGVVDGVDEIIFSGSSASVRHVSGKPPREVRASFSAPLPRSIVSLDLISTSGRGVVVVVQHPSPDNGYTAIVRIDDSGKGSDKRYEFTLRWTLK
jgi:BON domain-containing protein